jgi:AP endonuclease-1
MLNEGFVDTFRHFYPDLEKKYSFWTYMMNARSKNVGWRLDYFITSKRLLDQICDNQIRAQVFGSDHCPSTLFLAL